MLALAMGLNPACEIFTSFDKLPTRNFHEELRAHVYPFLEDLTGAEGGQDAKEKANILSRDLEIAFRKAAVGQVLHLEKSTIEAVQQLETVGWLVRTNPEVTLEPKPTRVEKTIGLVKSLLDRIELTYEDGDTKKENPTGVRLIATPLEAAEIGSLYQSNGKVTPWISMFPACPIYRSCERSLRPFPKSRGHMHASMGYFRQEKELLQPRGDL